MKIVQVGFGVVLIQAMTLVVFALEHTGKISPVEAIHLVEAKWNEIDPTARHTTTDVNIQQRDERSYYIVSGAVGSHPSRSTVNADTARVMKIESNGVLRYEWNGPIVVGHRGNVKFAPENTLPAFEAAIEHGADLLEIDVRETKDGVLVIMHDDTVDRTTDGSGLVADLTLAEIKQLDAGSWFDPKFKGTTVPTLREALRAMRGKALPDIDFKAGTPGKLVEMLREEDLIGKVTVYCGDWDLMQQTKNLTDDLLWRPTVPFYGVQGLPIVLRQFDPPIINIDWIDFSEELVRKVHLAGRKSFLNTMQHDTELGIRLMIDTMPDYIQSDQIDILVQLLHERGWKRSP